MSSSKVRSVFPKSRSPAYTTTHKIEESVQNLSDVTCAVHAELTLRGACLSISWLVLNVVVSSFHATSMSPFFSTATRRQSLHCAALFLTFDTLLVDFLALCAQSGLLQTSPCARAVPACSPLKLEGLSALMFSPTL